jgi:hypothetical protein
MRELKFRGKRIDNGEWVYGSYHYCAGPGFIRENVWGDGNRTFVDKPVHFNNHWILSHRTPSDVGWDIRDTFSAHTVIPETASQFTGLSDKNDKEIYEGDIIQKGGFIWKIIWDTHRAGFAFFEIKGRKPKIFDGRLPSPVAAQKYLMAQVEVIGNIYETPDLLTTKPI